MVSGSDTGGVEIGGDETGGDDRVLCAGELDGEPRKDWQVTLMIHKTTKSVLYMEAGKNFVDLLFSFLTLPTSRVLKLIGRLGKDKRRPGTAMATVFDSVGKLRLKDFLGSDARKQLMDQPICADISRDVGRIVKCKRRTERYFVAKTYYHCDCHGVLIGDDIGPATCNVCYGRVASEGNRCTVYHNFGNEGHGFLQEGSSTYMITNTLRITRASTENIMPLLAELKVQSLSDLETCRAGVSEKQAL